MPNSKKNVENLETLMKAIGVFIIVGLVLVFMPEFAKAQVELWYGNLDGSPLQSSIGEEILIPVYISTPAGLNITGALISLGTDDQYVSDRLGGNFYYPFTQWSYSGFTGIVHDSPFDGWSSQAFIAFADVGEPPLEFSNPTKIIEFRVSIPEDESLMGQTVNALGPGNNPPLGVTQFNNLYDTFYPVQHFSQIKISGCSDLGFQLGRDNWQFPNHRDSNLWPEFLPYPSWSLFVRAFGESQCYWPSGRPRGQYLAYWTILVWNYRFYKGSCFGFATSDLLFFDGILSVQDEFGQETLYQVPLSDESKEMVNKYQLYQHGSRQVNHINWKKRSTTPRSTLEESQEMFISPPGNHKVLMLFDQKDIRSHAVNPIRCEYDEGNPDLCYIYVYDNIHPNMVQRVTIDISTDTWTYSTSDANWGGHIFLMDPIINYTTNPILPFSGPSREEGSVQSNLLISEYIGAYFSSADSIIFESSVGNIGIYEDSLFSNVADACPIDLISLEATQPMGYFLPNDVWTCRFSNLADSAFRFLLFTDSTALAYSRSGVESGQHEQINYLGNDSSLIIFNPDNQARNYSLDMICVAPDSEVHYGISDMSIEHQDSAIFLITNRPGAQLCNYGAQKTYDLLFEIASVRGYRIFSHDSLLIESNASHLIAPDSSFQTNDSLTILVDNNLDGDFEDTISVENEYFHGYYYLPGDANMSNETVDSGNPLSGPWRVGGDITFLVNYFDITSGNQPCLMYNPNTPDIPGGPQGGYFFASADATGECLVTAGDVSRLVQYFAGNPAGIVRWCGWDKPDPENYYQPLWLNNRGSGGPQPVPPLEDLPPGWPNCETQPPAAARVIPSDSSSK